LVARLAHNVGYRMEEAMDYRSILVHLDDDESRPSLDVAAALARQHGAELAGAYLVATRELTPFTSAMLPDSVVEHRLRDTGQAQSRAEARFREVAARHGLASVAFSAPAGAAIDAAVLHARHADLAVLAQPRAGFESDLAHAVLMQSGRPVLIVPPAVASPVGERILIGWKESRESARAVADALPLLARAKAVRIVSITDEGDEEPRETVADKDVVAWLARHGVEAPLRHEIADDVDAGNLLLSRAADFGADLVVMGGYSRPRLSEVVLGGVTRLMLQSTTVPVLMSH
jgi:nucleotide-binding universal stress UspA family protein